MKLSVIASGSAGNAYTLTDQKGSILLIEAGVKAKEVMQSISFKSERVQACLISHEHGDHAAYAAKLLNNYGIRICASEGTLGAIGLLSKPLTAALRAGEKYKLGDYTIMPFRVMHDAVEPFGYLINHPESGTILFATDTYYLPNKFAGLRHIMIECNYSANLVDKNYRDRVINKAQRDRILESHMSLDTCIATLKANDLSRCNNIILLHLSDRNSNAKNFRNEVQGHTGIDTFVAESGLTIELSKEPF